MDREVSALVSIGTMLMLTSAVIGIIYYTVHIGMGVKADVYENTSGVVIKMGRGQLQGMVGQENHIPSAAAYRVLREYGGYIPYMLYKGGKNGEDVEQDLTVETPIVINKMRGKVGVEVVEEEDWYRVIIHRSECTWYYGTCNCDTLE